MVDPQASRFWRASLQSGLVDVANLQSCWEAVPESKRTVDAIDRRLARQAVNAGYLTVWQAQQLLTGRVTGFKIDRYVLLDLVGQGGMGRVYLAKDSRLGRRVALKVLSKERMNNARAIARFLREAKVGAQLQHENLVRIYDEGEAAGIRYLVMEFIEGKNVAQLIAEQGALPWPAAARLARQVAMGLDHARLKGLIHRDVNPGNILVTRDGTAKLTDLGLAIDLADQENVTRDGATVGTFDYISPEQAKHSRSVDTRTDIYSLGCTIFHMIAGRVPFPVPSLPEKLYAHQLHDAEPLNELVNDVPEGLARVVQKMMRKDPEERFATPDQVAAALEPFVDESAKIDPDAPPSVTVSIDAFPVGDHQTRIADPIRIDETNLAASPDSPATAPPPTASSLASDPDLAMFVVNTGPEVPLSATLSSSRSKSRPKPAVLEGTAAEAPRRSSTFAILAAAILALTAIGAGVGWVVTHRDKAKPPRLVPPAKVVKADAPSKKPVEAARVEPPRASAAFTVVSRDGSRVAATLDEAIAIAGGNGGEVVIAAGVHRIANDKDIRIPRGQVTIRAAEGGSATLALEMSASRPFLLITPGASLTLKNLQFIAHYGSQDKAPGLIQSGGNLTLDRCAFLATGSAGNSRAVRIEGLKLAIDGCLFEGFDRTIDVEAFPGSEATIQRSMIIHAGGTEQSPAWAIRIRHAGMNPATTSKAAPKLSRLSVHHSTIKGSGFLELSGFSVATPLVVDLDHDAIQARAMIAWTPRVGEPVEQWAKGMKWTAKANRYDITGNAWTVLSAAGELPMTNAPPDLAGWSTAVGTDKDATAESFQFASGPTADPIASDPARYAIRDVKGVGADPTSVGPRPARSSP